MTAVDFEKHLDEQLARVRNTLSAKAREYASTEDRLHNFKRASGITGETPAEVCVGFMAKHLASILDIVEADSHDRYTSTEVLDEKFGDAVNYLILLHAILLERRKALSYE